jgi:chromosome segregation ATPase
MKRDAKNILNGTSENRRNSSKLNKKIGGTKLVREAVSDLDREISQIRKDKTGLNSELRNLDQTLDNAKQLGKVLQTKITKLEDQEMILIDKKKSLKQKNDSLSERLSKVKAIKDQLSEI